MISVKAYFGPKLGHPEATEAMVENAEALLGKVNALLERAGAECGYACEIDPDTGSSVSGSKGGAGDGGFRLGASKTGATNSKHKLARAVDVYDPDDRLDTWISSFDSEGGAGNSLLEELGLYREAPGATPGWCHLQDLAPGSGRHTFNP